MNEDILRAAIVSVLQTQKDEEENERTTQLLKHIKKIFKIPADKYERLHEECLKYRTFLLEVNANDISPTERVVVSIEHGNKKASEHTLNGGEMYEIEIGHRREAKISCCVVKMNGQTAVLRRNSLFRRLSSHRRNNDTVFSTLSLPLHSLTKRTLIARGKTYHADIRLTYKLNNLISPNTLKVEDLVEFVRRIHEFDAKEKEIYDGELEEMSYFILHNTFLLNELPSIMLKTLCLSVFLVWDRSISDISDKALSSIAETIGKNNEEIERNGQLSKSVEYLCDCLEAHIDDILEEIDFQLFPPVVVSQFVVVHETLKTTVSICALSLWDSFHQLNPAEYISNRLIEWITSSVLEWNIYRLHAPSLPSHDLCSSIQSIIRSLYTFHPPYSTYFNQFSINYLSLVLQTLDAELETHVCRHIGQITHNLDSRDAEDLDNYSKNTMKTFVALGWLRKMGEKFNISLKHLTRFEWWFNECIVFWTFSWSETSLRMVERISYLEEEGECRSSLSHPLPSALYSFLCIQKGLSDDLCSLQLEDLSNTVLVTTKVVHIFCENLFAYSRKLYVESKEGDERSRIRHLRAVNGIDHSINYINEHWKKFVEWQRVSLLLEENEATLLLRKLEEMLAMCQEHCDLLADKIVERVYGGRIEESEKWGRQLCVDRNEYMKTLAAYVRDRIDSFHNAEQVVNAMERMREQMEKEISERRMMRFLHRIYRRLEDEIKEDLEDCQGNEYYRNIYIAVKIIREICGVSNTQSTLQISLHLKSLPSSLLILSHYADLVDISDRSPLSCSISIRTMHRTNQDDEEKVTLFIKVRHANLSPPSLCVSDCVCRLELLPKFMFPDALFPPTTTQSVPGGHSPKWREAYKIVIPRDFFLMNGSVLCLSIMDHDGLGCNRLIGRAFLPLNKIRKQLHSDHPSPTVSLPLLHPSTGSQLQYFQMLRQRSTFDPLAKTFWKNEKNARELHFGQFGICQLKTVPIRLSSLRRFGSEKLRTQRKKLSERGAKTI